MKKLALILIAVFSCQPLFAYSIINSTDTDVHVELIYSSSLYSRHEYTVPAHAQYSIDTTHLEKNVMIFSKFWVDRKNSRQFWTEHGFCSDYFNVNFRFEFHNGEYYLLKS